MKLRGRREAIGLVLTTAMVPAPMGGGMGMDLAMVAMDRLMGWGNVPGAKGVIIRGPGLGSMSHRGFSLGFLRLFGMMERLQWVECVGARFSHVGLRVRPFLSF